MGIDGGDTIRLCEVTHLYRGLSTPVLSAVDASFVRGQLVAVTGPSGSGKTTLLSVLGLLFRPTHGQVLIGGGDAWSTTAASDRLRSDFFAWVLQNSACLEARTALDNVAIGLLAQGMTRTDARIAASKVLGLVGLSERETARASQLSGGELQRMTVSRALATGRPFILADEPTGQLDRANTISVVAALRACAERGAGVVIATHDAAVAAACDLVVALVDGVVAGSPQPGEGS